MNFEDIKSNVGTLTMDVTALDILLQFENILEDSGIYVYKNWDSGEVVEGPKIERHWVEVGLMYPLKAMPEPVGGKRLINIGAKVTFQKDEYENPVRVKDPEDIADKSTMQPKLRKYPVWIVRIRIPKSLIDDEVDEYLELDDAEFDVDEPEAPEAYLDDNDGISGTQEENEDILQDTGGPDEF